MKGVVNSGPPKAFKQVNGKSKSVVGKRKLSSYEQFKTNEAKREN